MVSTSQWFKDDKITEHKIEYQSQADDLPYLLVSSIELNYITLDGYQTHTFVTVGRRKRAASITECNSSVTNKDETKTVLFWLPTEIEW